MKLTFGALFRAGVICIAILALLAPPMALADGYSPLDMPPRGDGPAPSVQGENTDNDDEATPSASPTESEDDTSNITGAVQRVEDGKLIVEVDGEERELEVGDDATITRDGEEVALSDVQSGDMATVERNEDGDIVEVRIASQQSMNFWRGFLPILLVVLVGFYLLSRKRDQKKA